MPSSPPTVWPTGLSNLPARCRGLPRSTELARRHRGAGEGLGDRHDDVRRFSRRAPRARRAAFVEAGARATDHGHLLADTTPMEVNAARELYSRVLGGTDASGGRGRGVRGQHAFPDGGDVLRGRPGDADPPGRSARPQLRHGENVRAGQGLRHTDSDRVHPGPATDAGPVRHRPAIPRHPLHRRRDGV